MDFIESPTKGIKRLFVAEGVDPARLHVHLSELDPGSRPHPPHSHTGVEAFYVLAGSGTVEVEGAKCPLGEGECLVLDAAREHGLRNTGDTPMRYLVIIAR